MKIGVITDGISRDLEHALKVVDESGLEYVELQFLWDQEIGDQTDEEVQKIKELVTSHNLKVSCLSRHIFGGVKVNDVNIDGPVYKKHYNALKRNIEIAKELDCPIVRAFSGSREVIMFGSGGAKKWVVNNSAWDNLVKCMKPFAKLGEDEGITVAIETGNNAVVCSAYLACKLIDDVGSDNLRIIWDIPNTLSCGDIPYPEGYDFVRPVTAHIHLKDADVFPTKATVNFKELGTGHVGPYLENIAKALKKDNYQGVISYESVYSPEGGSFEDGFRASLPLFKNLFE
ncbi:MAG: sugar phosphate isomerase/epimerase family protein [Promethearchaeota archaeon]